MRPIATLTMNPALDVATATERVEPVHKLRCGAPRHDPGGGGINVARVVRTLGGEAVAVFPAGGPTGRAVKALLGDMGVPLKAIPIAGSTRESFTVDETESDRQFRFVLPGPSLSGEEQEACIGAILALDPRPGYVVASGSLPPGVSADFYARVARAAEAIGARCVLDTSGEALRHAACSGVFLMKPSLREFQDLVGREVEGEADIVAAARGLIREGCARAIVVSLGADGAILVSEEHVETFRAPDVPAESAVGAGDSMVGAIVLGLERGFSLPKAVLFGVAAGAATIMTPGTELCRRGDVERLFTREIASREEHGTRNGVASRA